MQEIKHFCLKYEQIELECKNILYLFEFFQKAGLCHETSSSYKVYSNVLWSELRMRWLPTRTHTLVRDFAARWRMEIYTDYRQ